MNDYSKEQLLIDMGQRYYAARKKLGLTQEQAAEIGETNQQSISDAERGLYFLSTDVVYRLCIGYGISSDYLLFGKEIDAGHAPDSRIKQLTTDQLFHYNAMLDHYFAALGIQSPDNTEDSR